MSDVYIALAGWVVFLALIGWIGAWALDGLFGKGSPWRSRE